MSDDDLPVFTLTVYQPWAWAIIYGGKNIENRSWKPRRPCRVLIHAGITLDIGGHAWLQQLRRQGVVSLPVPREYPARQIIGRVDVTGWDHETLVTNPWARSGLWHWHLENPVPATHPIEMRGYPAFHKPPRDWQRAFPELEAQ